MSHKSITTSFVGRYWLGFILSNIQRLIWKLVHSLHTLHPPGHTQSLDSLFESSSRTFFGSANSLCLLRIIRRGPPRPRPSFLCLWRTVAFYSPSISAEWVAGCALHCKQTPAHPTTSTPGDSCCARGAREAWKKVPEAPRSPSQARTPRNPCRSRSAAASHLCRRLLGIRLGLEAEPSSGGRP